MELLYMIVRDFFRFWTGLLKLSVRPFRKRRRRRRW